MSEQKRQVSKFLLDGLYNPCSPLSMLLGVCTEVMGEIIWKRTRDKKSKSQNDKKAKRQFWLPTLHADWRWGRSSGRKCWTCGTGRSSLDLICVTTHMRISNPCRTSKFIFNQEEHDKNKMLIFGRIFVALSQLDCLWLRINNLKETLYSNTSNHWMDSWLVFLKPPPIKASEMLGRTSDTRMLWSAIVCLGLGLL